MGKLYLKKSLFRLLEEEFKPFVYNNNFGQFFYIKSLQLVNQEIVCLPFCNKEKPHLLIHYCINDNNIVKYSFCAKFTDYIDMINKKDIYL